MSHENMCLFALAGGSISGLVMAPDVYGCKSKAYKYDHADDYGLAFRYGNAYDEGLAAVCNWCNGLRCDRRDNHVASALGHSLDIGIGGIVSRITYRDVCYMKEQHKGGNG